MRINRGTAGLIIIAMCMVGQLCHPLHGGCSSMKDVWSKD